ncbi:ABC-type transport auxiliary lipoprotein family protein [Brevundimonas sp.]|uniref:ABC-type transport auxiliary lipoprotein family protein n=1 Tax=Brevundimonas sp. TaxID=1871086 RepID=UPI0028983BAC|nr:ABC-type transport auxiliary lipoprotein family protein [Brevundimonas sp.]
MIRILTPMAVLAVTATLSGCAVLKTPDPVQTYRFGAMPVFARADAVAKSCEPVPVSLRRIDFESASRGDRLLTVTGSETAYIGTGRWVSQAETLFHSSLEDAFAAGAPCVRLASGSFARDGLLLSVDVRRFETVYASAGAVPDVHVSVAVHLTNREREVVASNRFDSIESAGENRVASIVAAYNRANADVTRQIVEWTATEVAVVR